MSVSYDIFTGAFLEKIKDYHHLELDETVTEESVDSYMKRACAQFNPMCLYNLLSFDDTGRVINTDIDSNDLYAIVDIVSEGMIVQWLKPYVYDAELYENVLNTKDFTEYSPAELLKQVSASYHTARLVYTNLMRDYSYMYGDLTDLSLP